MSADEARGCSECGWDDGIHAFDCPKRENFDAYHIYSKADELKRLRLPAEKEQPAKHDFVMGPFPNICASCGRERNDYQYHFEAEKEQGEQLCGNPYYSDTGVKKFCKKSLGHEEMTCGAARNERKMIPTADDIASKAQPLEQDDDLAEAILWWKDGENPASFSDDGLRKFINALIAALPNVEPQRLEEPLTHRLNCPAWHNDHGHEVNAEDCTCGLHWRLALQTEQAWRKRADEAEARESELLKVKPSPFLPAEVLYNAMDLLQMYVQGYTPKDEAQAAIDFYNNQEHEERYTLKPVEPYREQGEILTEAQREKETKPLVERIARYIESDSECLLPIVVEETKKNYGVRLLKVMADEIRQKFADQPGAVDTVREEEPQNSEEGTFACPVCGTDVPHDHTGEEVAVYRGVRATKDDCVRALHSGAKALMEHALRYGREGRTSSCDAYIKFAVILRSIARQQPSAMEMPGQEKVWRHLVKRMFDECGSAKAEEFIRRVECGEHDVPSPWAEAKSVVEMPEPLVSDERLNRHCVHGLKYPGNICNMARELQAWRKWAEAARKEVGE